MEEAAKERRIQGRILASGWDGVGARVMIVDPRDPARNEDMEYRLQKHQDVWLVHDILMDIDIVTHFRTQFDQIIRQESYAELVRRLE